MPRKVNGMESRDESLPCSKKQKWWWMLYAVNMMWWNRFLFWVIDKSCKRSWYVWSDEFYGIVELDVGEFYHIWTTCWRESKLWLEMEGIVMDTSFWTLTMYTLKPKEPKYNLIHLLSLWLNVCESFMNFLIYHLNAVLS